MAYSFSNYILASTQQVRPTGAGSAWRLTTWGCVVIQTVTTLLFPAQCWSMPIGLACLILICAALTIKHRPTAVSERWRCSLIACSFVIWALGFAAIAFQQRFFHSCEYISGILSMFHQFILIAALMPSSRLETRYPFRGLDLTLSGAFAVLLGLLTWGNILAVHGKHPTEQFIFVGYAALTLLSLLSYIAQEHRDDKSLIGRVSLLTAIYGTTSGLSIYIHDHYKVADNSLIWLIGDISFVVYASLSYSRKGISELKDHFLIEGDERFRRHLLPSIIASMLLVLSFIASSINFKVATITALIGIAVYATRMTLILNHYLSEARQRVVAERDHSRLLVDMIHEIRAPLASIVLNASMFQRVSLLEAKHAKWVRQIGEGSTRVTRILNDVLEIERMDAGLVCADIGSCNIAEVAHSAVGIVAAQASDAQIALAIDIDDRLNALADKGMLDRVFINLLSNAVRFTPAGGKVSITAFWNQRSKVIIRVADTGVGISEDRQLTLFKRFVCLGAPLRGPRGTGLGLSICRALMTAMDGEIMIESETTKGTTAILELRHCN